MGGARKFPKTRRPPRRARHLDVPERQQDLRIDGWLSICRPAPEVLLVKHLQASMVNRLRWMDPVELLLHHRRVEPRRTHREVEVGCKPMHVVGVHVEDLPDGRVL